MTALAVDDFLKKTIQQPDPNAHREKHFCYKQLITTGAIMDCRVGGVEQSSVKCSVKNENQSVEWGVQGVECESETAQCNVQNLKFGVWSVQCVDCRMRGVEWTLQKAAWEAKVWRVEYGVWSSKWGVCVDC